MVWEVLQGAAIGLVIGSFILFMAEQWDRSHK